jgi:hypothetical protein
MESDVAIIGGAHTRHADMCDMHAEEIFKLYNNASENELGHCALDCPTEKRRSEEGK